MSSPGVFLRAEWRALLMLNYPIDPLILKPFVPRGSEIDFWNGQTFVSMVGFRFIHTRLLGLLIPFHQNFDEINLRFYVRRKVGDSWRRGVVFIKEIVPRFMIAFVARTVYNERYVRYPMRHTVILPENNIPGTVHYEWKQNGNWYGLRAQIHGEAQPAPEESEARFITEHYWGYSMQRDGSTMEYEVGHPPWKLWEARDVSFQCDVPLVYGEIFTKVLNQSPSSAFVADGSPIWVCKGTRLPE